MLGASVVLVLDVDVVLLVVIESVVVGSPLHAGRPARQQGRHVVLRSRWQLFCACLWVPRA